MVKDWVVGGVGRVALSGLAALTVVSVARGAAATTINVNATCTLPEAVTSFNDLALNPLATPQPGCTFVNDGQSARTIAIGPGTVNVPTSLNVRATMTVIGAGRAQTTVATSGAYGFIVDGAGGAAPVLTLRAFSLIRAAGAPTDTTGVLVDGQAQTAHLALDGVRLADFGENGLEAQGVLEGPLSSVNVVDSIIENNTLAGIEVLNAGLTISGSNVSGNSNGGVRATLDDLLLQVSISNSTIADNAAELGAGVFFDGVRGDSDVPQFSILDSTIEGNTANLDGGGAFVTETIALFERAVMRDNDAGRDGGGIFGSEGFDFTGVNLQLSEATLLGNHAIAGSGGGLAIRNPGSRSALIERSLLAENVAALDGGGAYMDALGVVFDNSTLDGNAAARGGGWYYAGPSEGGISNCTVTGNTATIEGGGLHFERANPIFWNNLIATNAAPFAPDIVVTPSLGPLGLRCLIGDDEGAEGAFPPEDGNIVGVDPLLGERQNLGGPTEVRPLLAGSPAIDAAETGPEVDQRGVSRPQAAAFDIGAFEGSCNENEQELVSNQGFEANAAGWVGSFGTEISSSTLQAHSGSRSLRVANRNLGTWQGAEYNLLGSAVPGETLAASLWARVAGDPSEPVLFTLRSVCQGSPAVFTTVASATATNTGWVALNGTFEIPSCTLTELAVYAEGPRTGVVLYVDDVSVQRITLQCDGAQTPLDGTFIVTTDWGSGYCVELRVTNSNTFSTSDWSATFGLNGTTIYTIWNLDTTGLTGSPTVSPNAPFGQVIAPGAATHSLGFCADRPPGNTALPSGLVVTGVF